MAEDKKSRYRDDPEYRKRRQAENKKWLAAQPDRKKIRAKWNRTYRYGMSEERFSQLLAKQENKCAICGVDISLENAAHVDHCHKSKKVRGLLCIRCNRAIGMFRDDENILQKAINYLTNFSSSVMIEE